MDCLQPVAGASSHWIPPESRPLMTCHLLCTVHVLLSAAEPSLSSTVGEPFSACILVGIIDLLSGMPDASAHSLLRASPLPSEQTMWRSFHSPCRSGSWSFPVAVSSSFHCRPLLAPGDQQCARGLSSWRPRLPSHGNETSPGIHRRSHTSTGATTKPNLCTCFA